MRCMIIRMPKPRTSNDLDPLGVAVYPFVDLLPLRGAFMLGPCFKMWFLGVVFSYAIILMRKGEMVALL